MPSDNINDGCLDLDVRIYEQSKVGVKKNIPPPPLKPLMEKEYMNDICNPSLTSQNLIFLLELSCTRDEDQNPKDFHLEETKSGIWILFKDVY